MLKISVFSLRMEHREESPKQYSIGVEKGSDEATGKLKIAASLRFVKLPENVGNLPEKSQAWRAAACEVMGL